MEQRLLGTTGLRVSELCFGTMSFGDMADEATSAALYRCAREAGIDFFDCANVYSAGRAEEILGRLVAGERNRLVLTTKVGFPIGKDPNDRGLSRRHILQSVEASLGRLGTDRIEILFVHTWDPVTSVDETLRALDLLVQQGKALYLGVSNWAAWQIALALGASAQEGLASFACVQPMYSVVKRQAEVEILPLARAAGLGVVSYSPLGGGLLSGKYGRGRKPERGRLVENRMYAARYGDDRLLRRRRTLRGAGDAKRACIRQRLPSRGSRRIPPSRHRFSEHATSSNSSRRSPQPTSRCPTTCTRGSLLWCRLLLPPRIAAKSSAASRTAAAPRSTSSRGSACVAVLLGVAHGRAPRRSSRSEACDERRHSRLRIAVHEAHCPARARTWRVLGHPSRHGAARADPRGRAGGDHPVGRAADGVRARSAEARRSSLWRGHSASWYLLWHAAARAASRRRGARHRNAVVRCRSSRARGGPPVRRNRVRRHGLDEPFDGRGLSARPGGRRLRRRRRILTRS